MRRVARHRAAVKAPGGVAERRHDDGEADEQRQRADDQRRRDDRAPQRDRARIVAREPGRGDDGRGEADVAIEHQRKRHDADRQRQRRKAKPDGAADDDQRPAPARGQNVVQERRGRGGRLRSIEPGVKVLRGSDPQREQRQQKEAEHDHGGERRRAKHGEGVPPRRRQARLAPPAELIEADGEERPEQRKARGQREDEVQRARERRQGRQHNAGEGIENADERDMRRHRQKIRKPFLQRGKTVAGPEPAERDRRLERLGPEIDMESIRHGRPPQCFFRGTSARPRRRDLLGRGRLAEGAPHERAYGAKRWVLWGGGAAFLWRGVGRGRRPRLGRVIDPALQGETQPHRHGADRAWRLPDASKMRGRPEAAAGPAPPWLDIR